MQAEYQNGENKVYFERKGVHGRKLDSEETEPCQSEAEMKKHLTKIYGPGFTESENYREEKGWKVAFERHEEEGLNLHFVSRRRTPNRIRRRKEGNHRQYLYDLLPPQDHSGRSHQTQEAHVNNCSNLLLS